MRHVADDVRDGRIGQRVDLDLVAHEIVGKTAHLDVTRTAARAEEKGKGDGDAFHGASIRRGAQGSNFSASGHSGRRVVMESVMERQRSERFRYSFSCASFSGVIAPKSPRASAGKCANG